MKNKPLVSVIIPVYNREQYVAEAIESVRQQTYRNFELIIVDDGSTDNTHHIVRSIKEVRYIHQPNQGVAGARNTGIAAAQGEFLAFCDSDDVWPDHKLKTQLKFLLDHPTVDYTIGHLKNFIDPGFELPSGVTEKLFEADRIGLMTLVSRRAVFQQLGDFNPDYRVASDLDWFKRATDAGVIMKLLPEILLLRRIHKTNISLHQVKTLKKSVMRIFKASLDRQRKQKKD
ncbi:glycosyltransferase family 2 protein [candidate division CSSED10-310 bacterium]|uniref:Glycosyltransferase family 2 protein n=1 Tax=candidate division CSSED10-310 bacterium TaxID=2855610 RepID=A0ABV6Z0R9_UNCC1